MGFSTHEIWMVLRARNEAQATMSAASRMFSDLDNSMAAQARTAITSTQNIMAAESQRFQSYMQGATNAQAATRNIISTYQMERQNYISGAKSAIAANDATIASIKAKGGAISEVDKIQIAAAEASTAAIRRSVGEQVPELDRLITTHKNVSLVQQDATRAVKNSQAILKEVHMQEIADLQRTVDAHNQKMHTMSSAGQAAMMMGTAFAIAGGLMVAGFVDAGKASRDYAQDVAATFTQVGDKATFSADWIIKTGKRVASEYPVEFASIQPALYDMFSSIEVRSTEVADVIINNVAKAAIAGAVGVETASKSVLQIINAWHMDISDVSSATETLNRVTDIQFALVRDGVGTYEEFSNTIGRSIPSAVNANQTFEEMAGAIAFLTRQGVSGAMTSTALGRTFDLIANSKFEKKMQEIGLTTRDANNEFKPLTQIVSELRERLKGMSSGDQADFMKQLTLGTGGTTQAMRFLNAAVNDSEFSLKDLQSLADDSGITLEELQDRIRNAGGLLEYLTSNMYNASGATQEAYDIMKETPEAKIQGLANEFEIFKIAVGDVVNIAILPFVDALKGFFEWFNLLDPSIQNAIIAFGIIITVITVVVGVVLLIGGGIAVAVAAMGGMSAAMGILTGVMLPVIAVVLAIIAVIALLIIYWPQIVEAMQPFIKAAQELWDRIFPALQKAFESLMEKLKEFWDHIVTKLTPVWEALMQSIEEGKAVWEGIGAVIGAVFTFIIGVGVLLMNTLLGVFMGIIDGVVTFAQGLIAVVKGLVDIIVGVFTGDLQKIGEGVAAVFGGLIVMVTGLLEMLVGVVIGFVTGLVDGFIAMFEFLYDVLVGHSIVPDLVNAIIDWIKSLPGKVIGFINDLVNKAIDLFNNWKTSATNAILSLVNDVTKFFSELPGKITAFIQDLVNKALNLFNNWKTNSVNNVTTLVNESTKFMSELPGKIINAISRIAGDMTSQGTTWLNNLLSAVTNGANNVVSFVSGLPGKLIDAVSSLASSMGNVGHNMMVGMYNGIVGMAQNLINVVRKVVGNAVAAAKNLLGIASPSKVMMEIGVYTGEGLAVGLSKMRDRVVEASEMLAEAAVTDVDPFEVNTNGDDPRNGGDGPYSRFGKPKPPSGDSYSQSQPVVINQTINTQEINPLKHAADLGYEVATRLRF